MHKVELLVIHVTSSYSQSMPESKADLQKVSEYDQEIPHNHKLQTKLESQTADQVSLVTVNVM